MKRIYMMPLFLLSGVLLCAQADGSIEFRGEGTGRDYSEARAAALNDIAVQVGRYMFSLVTSDIRENLTYQSEKGRTLRDSEFTEAETRIFSEMAVSNISVHREFPLPRQADGSYKTVLSCLMNVQDLENQKNAFFQRIAENYAAQFRNITEHRIGLASDIRSLQMILRTLEKNPLHKAAAWFDLSEGRVNLYDYLSSQIHVWAGSVVFAPIPGQKARKGETLTLSTT